MYKCNVCGQPFSEIAGTPFFGLKTSTRTVCIALQELAEGLGTGDSGCGAHPRRETRHRAGLAEGGRSTLDQHVFRRADQSHAASPCQPIASQDAMLFQETGVSGVPLAPGAGLLSLLQTPRQLACRAARTDPDAGQWLAQEVATAYTRHGCWPDGSPLVSERVVNVPSTHDANVSAALVPPYRFARSRA